MLHSGSRGIGNAIGTYFIELARSDAERNQLHLPDRDLAYFPEGAQHFDDYVEAVGWAQDYARANRDEMMELVVDALHRHLPAFEATDEAVNCHHNYVERETPFRRGGLAHAQRRDPRRRAASSASFPAAWARAATSCAARAARRASSRARTAPGAG